MQSMKILIITALSIFIASTVITVCLAEEKAKDAGGGGFMFGVNILDVEELNIKLKTKGFEEFRRAFIPFTFHPSFNPTG